MTRKHYFSLSLLLLLFLSIRLTAIAQTIYFKHYTSKDGLLNNTIFMCHQDPDGYIWLASASGLTRFDGKNFKNYNYKNGLIKDIVIVVTNDSENDIWAKPYRGSTSFSLVRNSDIKIYHDSAIQKLPYNGLKLTEQYYSKKDKTTYLLGTKSLMCIKEYKKCHFKTTNLKKVISLFEDKNGEVLVGDGKDIYTVKDTIISLVQRLNLDEEYKSITYYNGNLYVSVNGAIIQYQHISDSFVKKSSYHIPHQQHRIHADEHGLWVSYVNTKKVSLYRRHNINAPPLEIDLPGYANRFLTDTEGGVWINTFDNGLVNIPNPEIITYTIDDGLNSQTISSICGVSNNMFWLGYKTGTVQLATIQNNKIKIQYTKDLSNNKVGYNPIINIKRKNGKTYVLSRHKIFEYYNNSFREIPISGATPYRALTIINDSLMCVSCSNGFAIFNTSKKTNHNIKFDVITNEVISANGTIWLGGLKGLYSYVIKNDSLYRTGHFLNNTIVYSTHTQGAYIYAGTIDSNLSIIQENGQQYSFTYDELMLPSYTITTILADSNNLLLGSDLGLYFTTINYDSFTFKNSILFTHKDGLLSSDIISLEKIDTGYLVGTMAGGLTLINSFQSKRRTYATTDITFKSLFNKQTYTGENINIQYSKEGVEIEFYTAALKYHEEVYYKYKLEPFHNEWRTTQNNVIQYTNIPPGEYKFHIQALDDRPNTTTTLSTTNIYIVPLFWQTLWFKALVGLFLMGLISLLFYWYYRYVKKQTSKQIERNRVLAKTKLEALKAQIKPHFIFNSLNGVKDYVYGNKEDDVADLLQKLSSLIRKALYLSENDYISVSDEILFLKASLDIEKVKCKNCFDFNIKADENIKGVYIPSLITQPFVENAVIHGVHSSNHERPYIEIAYTSMNNDIICSVLDNGIGIKKSLERKKYDTSKGIEISMKRVNYIKVGLDIDVNIQVQDRCDITDNENGTLVTITIKNILNKFHEDN